MQVKCPNILRYDKEAKSYVYCEHQFDVPPAEQGKVIDCPKCGGEVKLGQINLMSGGAQIADEVADPRDDLLADDWDFGTRTPPSKPGSVPTKADEKEPMDILGEPIAPLADPATSASGEDSLSLDDLADLAETSEPSSAGSSLAAPWQHNSPTTQTPTTQPEETLDEPLIEAEILPESSGSSSIDDPLALPATPAPVAPPGPLPSESNSTAALQVSSYCASCGGAWSTGEDVCSACGYHRVLQRCIRLKAPSKVDGEVGFQRWLGDMLVSGASARGLVMLVGGTFAAILAVLAVVTFIDSPALSLIFAIPCVFVVGLLIQFAIVSAMTKASGPRPPGFLQKACWNVVLWLMRRLKWRGGKPMHKRRILKATGPDYDDDDLLHDDRLAEAEVVDLQGTSVSDEGLTYLTAFPNVLFVVVRGTQTTIDGVSRLQMIKPKAWIWS